MSRVEAVRPLRREDARTPVSGFVHRGAAAADLPTDLRVRQALEAYRAHGAAESGAALLFGVDVYV